MKDLEHSLGGHEPQPKVVLEGNNEHRTIGALNFLEPSQKTFNRMYETL